jgi:hypothetical protein
VEFLASKPLLPSRANPPLAPPGLVRFHCEIHRNEVPPRLLISESFPSSSATLETLSTCSKSLPRRFCHRCASANCERIVTRIGQQHPFLARDCSRLAGTTYKILDFSVPFHPVYLNIATSTNFGCSKIFRRRRLGFVPPAAHLHHISQFLIFLTLGGLRNQSWVRPSRPASECRFI